VAVEVVVAMTPIAGAMVEVADLHNCNLLSTKAIFSKLQLAAQEGLGEVLQEVLAAATLGLVSFSKAILTLPML
jgi:hypothetical protein